MGETIFQFAGGSGNSEADAWVESRVVDQSLDSVWEPCKVLTQAGPLVNVRVTRTGKVLHVDLRKVAVFPASPAVASDISSLHYINEPCILHNLQNRSLSDKPYTFMGSVLVAVNPLKPIPDPDGAIGTSRAARFPHPYAIAEGAFQQMSFVADARRKGGKSPDDIANQSIITSGESGSGKTESSKMVLRHLVARTETGQAELDIDRRLLQSNPITESFGNASTLRNHNSSRFGKFMTLNFAQISTPRGAPAEWEITSGMVKTYLLERSRVTLHNQGERNYHVFYQFLEGATPSDRQFYGLDEPVQSKFRYLEAQKVEGAPSGGVKKSNAKKDGRNHTALLMALESIGMDDEKIQGILSVVAAVLHLGNAVFVDKEEKEGDVAVEAPPPKENPTYSALGWAVEMLGIDKSAMLDFLIKRSVKINGENMVVQRNSRATTFGRDAVAKGLYSTLFDWLILHINKSLAVRESPEASTGPFIGVLDIFGFESFQFNGFEQLLINYTNESLQSVFNFSVFVSEADLYKKEGLVLEEDLAPPPDNSESMKLLNGTKNAGTGVQLAALGVLGIINAESQNPNPSDKKLLSLLHNYYDTSSKAFVRPHPKDADRIFIVNHYAGQVTYTAGSFIEKNNDQLPAGVGTVFAKSSKEFVRELFAQPGKRRSSRFRGKRSRPTVCSQFKTQINSLVADLGKTRNSFIRCVKPNSEMVRVGSKSSWFNRRYVSSQLRCLSIPQTAEVLKSGLPTRVEYSALVQSYSTAIPADAIKMWQRTGGGDKVFVAALFFAFKIPRKDYRLGHTKVFFRSGKLAQLDQVFQAVHSWSRKGKSKAKEAAMPSQEEVVKRFKLYYVRAKWRKAYMTVVVMNHFQKILKKNMKRTQAVKKVVAFLRVAVARSKVKKLKQEKEREQQLLRAKKEAELKRKQENENAPTEENEGDTSSSTVEQKEVEENQVDKKPKGEIEELLEKDRGEIMKRERTVIQGVLKLKKKEIEQGSTLDRPQLSANRQASRKEMLRQFSGVTDLNTLTNMVSMSHLDLLADSDDEVDEDDIVYQGEVHVVRQGMPDEVMPAEEAKHGKKGRRSSKKSKKKKKKAHHHHDKKEHKDMEGDSEPAGDSDEDAELAIMMFGVPVTPETIEILEQEDVAYRIINESKAQEEKEYQEAVAKAAKHKKSKKYKIPTPEERELRRSELESQIAEKEIEYESSKSQAKVMKLLEVKHTKKKKKKAKAAKHSKKKETSPKDHVEEHEQDKNSDDGQSDTSMHGEPTAVVQSTADTMFWNSKTTVKPSLSFSSVESKRPGDLSGSKGHKLADMFHHAHHFMIHKAKEHGWFHRAIEEGKKVTELADNHNGNLGSTRHLLTNANGNIKVVQGNTVDKSEFERPAKSAAANVGMLKTLLDKGQIVPDEFATLTQQNVASIDRTLSHEAPAHGGLFRFVPGMFAKAPVHLLCPHCGEDNCTANGENCKACGWKLVPEDGESSSSDDESGPKHHARPPPVPKSMSTATSSQSKAGLSGKKKQAAGRGMPSEFDDWSEELFYKTGKVRFRVQEVSFQMDQAIMDEVRVFTVAVQWQDDATSRVRNWLVVHDYHAFRNLERELREGRSLSKAAQKMLGAFPTELSPTYYLQKKTNKEAREMMHTWLLSACEALKTNENGGRLSFRSMFRISSNKENRANGKANTDALNLSLVDLFFELKAHTMRT